MTPWQEYLDMLTRKRNRNRYLNLQDEMQSLWPGNYTVWEYWEETSGTFVCYLKFDTPQDETMFYLKYSHTICPQVGI